MIFTETGKARSVPINIASPGESVGRKLAAERSMSPDAFSTTSRSLLFVRRWTIIVPIWERTDSGRSLGLCVARQIVKQNFRPSLAINSKESK